jgi:hypothetical protein
VTKAHKVHKELKVNEALLVFLVTKAHKAHKEFKAHKVSEVLQDLLALLVNLVP